MGSRNPCLIGRFRRLTQAPRDRFRRAYLTQLVNRSELLQELQSGFAARDLVFFSARFDSIDILQAVIPGGFLDE